MRFLMLFFGEGPDLNAWQMSARAVLIFFIALVFIRISGRRSFGLHSPFDSCTTVLLGAILSRAVIGASPFLATVSAAAVLVILHRLIALASVHWGWFEKAVTGEEVLLVRNGKVDEDALKKALITHKDLDEAVRRKTGDEDLAKVEKVMLERNGDLTVVARA
jgi:uncharacterized membrane protein YcaP (DUF421 family)